MDGDSEERGAKKGGGGEGQRGRENGKRMENEEAGEMAGKCMEGGTKERERERGFPNRTFINQKTGSYGAKMYRLKTKDVPQRKCKYLMLVFL